MTKTAQAPLSQRLRQQLAAILPRNLFKWYQHKTTDAYLISFPKCGRTWLRLMIAHALLYHLGKEDATHANLSYLARQNADIPKIKVYHDGNPHLQTPTEINSDKSQYQGKKVVFLVRDPRDVLVSLYFHRTKRSHNYEGSLSQFLREEEGGLRSLITFYNIWADNQTTPSAFLLVKYEEMRQNPAAELRRILDFLSLPTITDAVIDRAVTATSFDKMRQLEKSGSFTSDKLKPGDQGDTESYKTRRGKVGGYVDYLTPDDIVYLDTQLNQHLSPFYSDYTISSQGQDNHD